MAKELKKYGLRATKSPARNALVSTLFIVRNEAGEVGYCYVNFDSPFVDKIGRVLPRGVMPEDPACVQVKFYPRTKVWLITAQYVSGTDETLLWSTPERPAWLNFWRLKDGHHPKARRGDKASGGPASGTCEEAGSDPQKRTVLSAKGPDPETGVPSGPGRAGSTRKKC